MEGRVNIGDMRRIGLRLFLPFFLLFMVSFIALEVAREYLEPEYYEVLHWLQYIIGFVIAALLIYWLVRAYRSRMEVTPKKWILYEGRAFPLANLVVSGASLFAALLLVVADSMTVPPGDYGLTEIGLLCLIMAILAFVNGLPSKLFVEKDGLVLKGGFSRFSMFVYIPFDELESLVLRGWILSYKEKQRLLRNMFIVQDRASLAEALNRSWKRLEKDMSATKTYYEGRAIPRRAIVSTGFVLLLGALFLLGGSMLLSNGNLLGIPILAAGLAFLALAALAVHASLRTRLFILDDGLVISQGAPSASTTEFVPFASLKAIELRSMIFTYRGEKTWVRGWFVVQDNKRLASAINRFWRRA